MTAHTYNTPLSLSSINSSFRDSTCRICNSDFLLLDVEEHRQYLYESPDKNSLESKIASTVSANSFRKIIMASLG
jgi:hypothetical protein